MRLRGQVLVQIMQPVDRISQSKRVMGANEELSLVFIEREELTVVGVAFLVAIQILLDVFEDG